MSAMITITIAQDEADLGGVLYKTIMSKVEKPLIEHALERTDGNQIKAARVLGINRNTIRAKIKRLGIDVSRWKASSK